MSKLVEFGEVDVDVERHGERQPVVMDAGERVGTGSRVKFIDRSAHAPDG